MELSVIWNCAVLVLRAGRSQRGNSEATTGRQWLGSKEVPNTVLGRVSRSLSRI